MPFYEKELELLAQLKVDEKFHENHDENSTLPSLFEAELVIDHDPNDTHILMRGIQGFFEIS